METVHNPMKYTWMNSLTTEFGIWHSGLRSVRVLKKSKAGFHWDAIQYS